MIVFAFFLIASSYAASLGPDYSQSQAACALCPGSSGMYCVNLATESPIGTIVGLHVQYNAVRKHPILSLTFLDDLNHQHTANRTDSFRRHPCASIYNSQCECKDSFKATLEQQEYSNSAVTPWDRGHLTPSQPFTYSEDANAKTFYCINVAPQDSYTNKGPWSRVESAVFDYFKGSRAGYVMTGICDANAPGLHSPTAAGFPVPSCFWKMVCYVDPAGHTRVVAFMADNTIVPAGNSDAQAARRNGTYTPRSQQDLLNVMSLSQGSIISSAWATGAAALFPGRSANNNVPTASQCRSVKTLTAGVRNEWAELLPSS